MSAEEARTVQVGEVLMFVHDIGDISDIRVTKKELPIIQQFHNLYYRANDFESANAHAYRNSIAYHEYIWGPH